MEQQMKLEKDLTTKTKILQDDLGARLAEWRRREELLNEEI